MVQDFTKITSSGTLAVSADAVAAENARFMAKVYLWMTVGLALSGLTAFGVATNESITGIILGNRLVFIGLILAELGVVVAFSRMINTASAAIATSMYLFYAFLSGLTLSVIFFVYTYQSIMHVFGITAFAFGGLSLTGFITKRDLGPIGNFCTMGLWGLIGFGLVSLFFPSMMMGAASKVYGIIGVIVFSGLTAYDTQKIKQMNTIGHEGTAEDHKGAVSGALMLYLDFINLFLSLLRVMGKRR